MTRSSQAIDKFGVRYYKPSASVIEYLERELQNLEPTKPGTISGKRQKFKRRIKGRGTIAKDKKDTFHKIFQGFVDLVYFLEYIEAHPELHELYEANLKDLFGINIDKLDKYGRRTRRRTRRKVWHWSLFVRFLSASLFNRASARSRLGFDFRIALAYVMIHQGIDAMRSRLASDPDELTLFNSNVSNAILWSKLLAGRYNEKQAYSRHRIGPFKEY